MKNVQIFTPKKYDNLPYYEVEANIYRIDNRYVTSLSFQQEPEFGEGKSAAEISQYPLEDLQDWFSVYVSDAYKELNITDSTICYLEFSSSKQERIQQLLSIVGKHVRNQIVYENGEEYIELVIE